MPRGSRATITQDFRPGLIGWARRRVLPLLSRVSALLGLLGLGAWIAGRVLTDEHHWSQYLYWTPPLIVLTGAWLLLLISWLCSKLASRLGGIVLRPMLLLLILGTSVYVPIGVWHLPRALSRRGEALGERTPGTIRVFHWNQAGQAIEQPLWGQRIHDLGVDIVFITNAQWGEARQTLLEQFAYFAPDDRRRWVNYSYRLHADPAHYRVEESALIASRYPMTRTGMVKFGSGERQRVMSHTSSKLGWVMFVEFDLDPERSDDEPLVVWFVDLPSDPTVWKMDVMRTTRQMVDSWDGSGWVMGRHVWEQYTDPDASFPEPDIIIGDFNTPRGSASLKKLAPEHRDAFELAGSGRGRSFVIRNGTTLERAFFALADLHIDLTLVGPNIRVKRYEILPTDVSDHNPQIIDIER